MRQLILVVLGGALGSGARHLTNVGAARALGTALPWATFGVNVIGSFLMGFVIETLARRYGGSPEARAFFATGILGGFTTFSAFTLDTATLIERGQMTVAAGYVVLSVVISLSVLYAGMALSKLLFS